MMLNEPVVIGGSNNDVALSMSIDEQRVRLHRRLKRIAKARGYLDLKEAEALREAQKVQLWKEFGHTSLADYMVNELGYTSHHTALERLRVANALTDLPKLTEAIQTGQINMTQAREITRVATPETEEKWIEKALDLNVRQVERAVAGHARGDLPEDPIDPRLVRKTMYLSVRPETEILFREARKALEAERGEKLDEDAVVEAMCRRVLEPGVRRGQEGSERSSPVERGEAGRGDGSVEHGNALSPHGDSAAEHRDGSSPAGCGDAAAEHRNGAGRGDAPYRDASSPAGRGDAEYRDGSSPAGRDDAEFSDSSPAGRDVAVPTRSAIGAAYRVAVTVCKHCKRGWQHGAGAVVELSPAAVERATCDAQWIGDLDSSLVERAHQGISPATRRNVLHRDHNCCRVPGCKSYTNLDIHHIVHRAQGGTNELSNLITLCEAHHLAHHNGTLQLERNGDDITFKRQTSNRFTRTTREVATRDELRRRGFAREVVAGILARTINIIGETDLTEEQWLTIALRTASEDAS